MRRGNNTVVVQTPATTPGSQPTPQAWLRRVAVAVLAVVMVSVTMVLAPAQPADADYDDTALTNAWEINGNVIYDIMRSGDVMYVGGDFSGPKSPTGTSFSQANLVAFDADTGDWISSFDPDINGIVETIEPNSDGTLLYVGGHFSQVNGATRHGVVALDPATGATVPGWVATLRSGDIAYDIEVDGNDVYIGGQFIKVNNVVNRRIARVDAVTGALDAGWDPNPDNKVLDMALAPDGERIYVVGRFLNFDGVFTNAVAAVETSTGDLVSGWTNTTITQARAVDATDDRVVVAYRKTNWVGFYDTAGTQIRRVKGDGDFQEVEIVADRALIGSHSFTFDALPQAKIQAAFLDDATVSTTLDAPAFGQPGVFAIYASGSDLWVGGDIWKIGTTSLMRLGIVPGDPSQSAPTLPTGLSATYLPANEIALSWTASTDDTGILGYRVLKSGNQIAFVESGTSYTDVSAQPGVNYVYNIEAVDIDHNVSDRSAPITISGAGGGDTQAPTVPGAPVAGTVTESTIDLTWAPSTDNVGVDHYDILRDGVVVGTSSTPSFTDTGLIVDTDYDYEIRAVDAVGNTSALSPTTTANTSADITAPDQPAAPTLVSAGLNEITLEWVEPADNVGVVSYRVFRDGSEIAASPTTLTQITDTGLAAMTSYDYTVTALDAAGNESAVSPATTMATSNDTTPPGVPPNLTATPAAGSVALDWDDSTDDVGVVSYNVSRDAGPAVSVTAPLSDYLDTGLVPNTTYAYTVTAFDAAGNESAEATVNATTTADTTDPDQPAAPTLVTALIDEITLGWIEPADDVGVVSYRVFRDGSEIAASPTTLTQITDTGLAAMTSYDYTVTALDAAGNESIVSPATAMATSGDTTAPDQPVAPTLVTAGLNEITLSWVEPADDVGVVSYRVFRDGVLVASPLAPIVMLTDTGLSPMTSYDYTVTALDAAGNESSVSPATTMTTSNDSTPPDVPPNLTATPAAASVALDWDDSTDDVGVVSYRVFRDGVEVAAPLAPTSDYTDIGLVPNTTYAYTVTALDAAGNESTAAAIGATTTADTTAPDTPPNLVATPTGASVALDWDEPADDVGVVSYRVFRDGVEVATPVAPTTDFTDIGLAPSTTYAYTVTALDAAGNESTAAAVGATTTADTTAPDQPAAPTLVAALLDEITLSWIEPADDVGVVSYRVFRDGAEVATPLAPTTDFTDTGLAPMTSYDYTVTALDAAGNESPVSPATAMATSDDTTAPDQPLNLSSAPTEASVALDWDEPFDDVGVVSYRVFRDGVEVAAPAAPTTDFTDTGLVPSTTYAYTVTALDAAGNESTAAAVSPTTTADTTDPTQPGAPTTTAVTSTTVSLTWAESTDAVGVVEYDVLRDGVVVGTVPATVFLDTGLLINTAYSYTVQARDAAGNESILSDATIVSTVGDIIPPTTPGAPVAGVVTGSSIEISWAPSSDNVGVTGYQILRDGAVVGTSTTTDFTDSGLVPGTSYDYSVKAVDAAGNESTESPATAIATEGDTEPPDTIATTPVDDQEFSGGIATFSGTATDNVGVGATYVAIKNLTPGDPNNGQWLQLDLVSWAGFKRLPVTMANPGAPSTTFTEDIALPDGEYGVSFVVDDTSGNRDPSKPWRKFTVVGGGGGGPDVERPVAAISSPNSNQNLNGPSVNFVGTATDNVGVVEVDLIIRDRNSGLYLRQNGSLGNFQRLSTTLVNPGDPSASWSATYDLPPGSYAVRAVAEDDAGNQSFKPKRNFTVS